MEPLKVSNLCKESKDVESLKEIQYAGKEKGELETINADMGLISTSFLLEQRVSIVKLHISLSKKIQKEISYIYKTIRQILEPYHGRNNRYIAKKSQSYNLQSLGH